MYLVIDHQVDGASSADFRQALHVQDCILHLCCRIRLDQTLGRLLPFLCQVSLHAQPICIFEHTWLLTTRWMVPPVLNSGRPCMSRVS